MPVKTLKEIWGVLEVQLVDQTTIPLRSCSLPQIVKEQCWINETLSAYKWTPEGLESDPLTNGAEDDDVSQGDLQAVLTGPWRRLSSRGAL